MVTPRYELRVWGRLQDVRRRLDALGVHTGDSTTTDLYLVGPDTRVNAKLRDRRLDVKHLIETRAGFQRWTPEWSSDLPLPAPARERLWSELGLSLPDGRHRAPLDRSALEGAIGDAAGAAAIAVDKQRRHFELDGVAAEASAFDIVGVRCWTVVVEDVDIERLERVRVKLGLDGPNVAVNEMVAAAAAFAPTGEDRGPGDRTAVSGGERRMED